MSLESATYISQLNASNPPGGDYIANAADHLRLIKSTLQNSFPNLGAFPVQSNAVQLSFNLVPVGGIIMWSGSIASIPSGWGLCNGTTYARLDGSGNITSPNLIDRFIVAAGYTYAPGATGGAVSHQHAISVAGTSLTQAQIPNLSIGISDPGHNHSVYDPGHAHSYNAPASPGASGGGAVGQVGTAATATVTSGTGISLYASGTGISAYTTATGGTYGQAHSHSASSDWQSSLPPYYALAFIMKL